MSSLEGDIPRVGVCVEDPIGTRASKFSSRGGKKCLRSKFFVGSEERTNGCFKLCLIFFS